MVFAGNDIDQPHGRLTVALIWGWRRIPRNCDTTRRSTPEIGGITPRDPVSLTLDDHDGQLQSGGIGGCSIGRTAMRNWRSPKAITRHA